MSTTGAVFLGRINKLYSHQPQGKDVQDGNECAYADQDVFWSVLEGGGGNEASSKSGGRHLAGGCEGVSGGRNRPGQRTGVTGGVL